MSRRIAIIACGNPNRSDDGAGMEVLRRILQSLGGQPPEDVSLLDAGTDGMAVMFAAKGCETLIIIDACRSGSDCGAVFEVPGDELEAHPPDGFNLHDFRWDHALFAGRKIFREQFPSDVTVFLIEAGALDLGIGLSPAVTQAAEQVASRVRGMIEERTTAPGEPAW